MCLGRVLWVRISKPKVLCLQPNKKGQQKVAKEKERWNTLEGHHDADEGSLVRIR